MENKNFTTLADLTPDPNNPNRGTERGLGMIQKSLERLGAGRSIVTDRAGRVLAGNKTLQQAVEIGLGAKFVESDGKDLIIVVRTDLDLDADARARELSICDNRSSELSLSWDNDVLANLYESSTELLSAYWTDNELKKLLSSKSPEDNESQSDEKDEIECPNCSYVWRPK